ncbi:MAG TPA: hypothetical protein VGC79_21335 [Polyangiaceae bacterium]
MKKSWLFLGGLSVVLTWLPSCSSDKPCQGAEKCECYANDTCNAGLACRSKTCVNLDTSGASGGSSSTGVDTSACLACADKTCADQAAACKSASGCKDSLSCFLNCGSTDPTCAANCGKGLTADSGAKAVGYYTCAITQCLDDCVHVPGAGGAGNPGTPSGGASSATGGSGNHAGMGSASAGMTSSGSAGAPATELTSGLNWLALVGNVAPSDYGVNPKLGVNGVLYAYGDGCASVYLDTSRCVTGTLCLASAENWGVAIGFDFDNSGETGTPPNTKHAWNAGTYGVTGLAWKVQAQTPAGFQVWVQNMDPSFSGTCSEMSCDIAGPADGSSVGSSSGSFSFATMEKDDWGGTGTAYTFNPANISAMQFKIKAATSSSLSYHLCVDQLGVLR